MFIDALLRILPFTFDGIIALGSIGFLVLGLRDLSRIKSQFIGNKRNISMQKGVGQLFTGLAFGLTAIAAAMVLFYPQRAIHIAGLVLGVFGLLFLLPAFFFLMRSKAEESGITER